METQTNLTLPEIDSPEEIQDPKQKWTDALSELKAEYNIQSGTKIDERSSRRIAIIVSELFIKTFPQKNSQISFYYLEPTIYQIARKYRLQCDPMDREERNPKAVDSMLKIWGADKGQGVEVKITNLEEWLEPLWRENGRATIFGSKSHGNARFEKIGLGSHAKEGANVCKGV